MDKATYKHIAYSRAEPRPPCPYCGERQAYDEARPSKPHVIRIAGKRETEYFTECRSCGQRIIWGFKYGDGSLAQLGTGRVTYHWSKPLIRKRPFNNQR